MDVFQETYIFKYESIYDHDVVMHMKFCQGILSNIGVIAHLLLKFE